MLDGFSTNSGGQRFEDSGLFYQPINIAGLTDNDATVFSNDLLPDALAALDLSEFEEATWTINVSVETQGGFSTLGFVSGNISSLTVVPIPAAAWLFGSALLGLGWMRRKV